MRAGGCKDGEYSLGGQKVIVKEGAARLESGALAGSVLAINVAFYNILNNTSADIGQAINYITINPAKLLGIENIKGTLDVGKDADIVIFNDKVEIINSFNKGKIIF